jgi:purine-nucleoside phosphorylase
LANTNPKRKRGERLPRTNAAWYWGPFPSSLALRASIEAGGLDLHKNHKLKEDQPMHELAANINEAVEIIRSQWQATPKVGIILGTGLGSLAEEIETQATLAYESIPHFPRSTSISHAGQLVCGTLQGVPVVAMEGRFHAYEGYSHRQITFPVRVMQALGAELLIVSNACGGLNPQYGQGHIMVIEDHINLMSGNPLIGVNDDKLGPRFPDMCEPYDAKLIDLTLSIARREDIAAHKGVYVAVTGPNLETRAEYRFLRTIGADVVGMSTVPEVIVAVHAGMRVLGLSIVTDLCLPDALESANIDKILAIAAEAEPKLRKLVLGVLAAEA